MPRLSSHARAASPSAPPSPSAAMADGGESGTPAPSPSTSVPLDLGLCLGPPAVDVGSFKYPSVAPPRRSLRFAGAASPTTPTAGSSAPDGGTSGSGSGSGGKSWGWPRVSAPAAAASPKIGELGSDGGGSEVRVSGVAGVGGSSGEGAFMSLRSGYRTAKRLMEPDVHMGGEMGLGLGGGVGAGDQVHDEMLHWDAEGPAKRCKSILVGSIEMVYVTDSESDDDEDCIVLSMRMPMQLSTAPDVIESNVAPLSTYNTDEGRNNDPVKGGKERFGEIRSTKNDLLSGEFVHIHNSLEMAVDGMINPLASPAGIGISATHEVDELYADMYLKEESDDDEDCIVLGMRMPMQLSTSPDVIESNVAPLSTYNTDKGRNNDPVKAGKEQFGEVRSTKNDLLSGEFMHIHNSLEMAVDGMINPLASPAGIGISATHEVDELYADMYLKEEIRRYGSRKGGRGKEKLVLGNNNSGSLSGEFMHIHNSLEMAVDGMIKPLASPAGISAAHEVDELYADMYLKEEIRRYGSRKGGRGKEKLVLGNNNSGSGATVGIRGDARTHKFSPHDKGKGKIVVEESSLSCSSSDDEMVLEPVVSEEIQSISRAVDAPVEPLRRQAARERAIALAPKFAFFKADGDVHSDDDDAEDLEPVADPQDWPGPFSTAMRIIDDRDAKLRARELNPSKLDKSADKVILWTPSKDRKTPGPSRPAPSLTSLCLETLSNHAEGIESLAGIPEELKHKLLTSLCHSRKMNNHLLDELLCDNPVTLRLSECSWLGEDDFETIFGKCKTEVLQVLQLDLSGRCMPDYILPATLAKAPNCMPLLTKISLKGNYRLSDNGLDTIISAAPSLSSLNLCECSLLTSTGIENLANKLHLILRELYIDDCLNVEAMMILPALQKVKHLEVLSMSGIQSICDKFVNELIPVHGSNLRELAFAGCLKLTSSSIKTVGGNCPQLSSLDLRNLNRLRDSAMRHLRNGCRLIKKLKLQRNTFSDEAVSQFLEESGGCLTELSLNNVEKAGNRTARAIAHMCSVRLEVLDLSFCRDLTNEALGLIVDSCSSLRILKLFGCTQITDVFLKGHSNSLVKIVGIEGNILEQMDSR